MALKILKNEYETPDKSNISQNDEMILKSEPHSSPKSEPLSINNEGLKNFDTFRKVSNRDKENIPKMQPASNDKIDRPSNEQSLPLDTQEEIVNSEISNEYDDYVEDFEDAKLNHTMSASQMDEVDDMSDASGSHHKIQQTNCDVDDSDHTSNDSKVEQIDNDKLNDSSSHKQPESLKSEVNKENSDLNVQKEKNESKNNLSNKNDEEIDQPGDRNDTLEIDDEGSSSDSESDTDTIVLNSDKEEPDYFKSIVKSQNENALSKANFMIKLEIKNKKVKLGDRKLGLQEKSSKRDRVEQSHKIKRHKNVHENSLSPGFKKNLNKSKLSYRKGVNLKQDSSKLNNALVQVNSSNTDKIQPTFKRRFMKQKKIIGDTTTEGMNNRIMISTSGSQQRRKLKNESHYGLNSRIQNIDRKSLKSAQPFRDLNQVGSLTINI